jgi:hypothetical protein
MSPRMTYEEQQSICQICNFCYYGIYGHVCAIFIENIIAKVLSKMTAWKFITDFLLLACFSYNKNFIYVFPGERIITTYIYKTVRIRFSVCAFLFHNDVHYFYKAHTFPCRNIERGKAVGAWMSSLTPIFKPGRDYMELNFNRPLLDYLKILVFTHEAVFASKCEVTSSYDIELFISHLLFFIFLQFSHTLDSSFIRPFIHSLIHSFILQNEIVLRPRNISFLAFQNSLICLLHVGVSPLFIP